MNVYDFDGTIYAGDSTIDFYWHTLKRAPKILRFIPKQLMGFLLFVTKIIDKTALKSYFFCFLSDIDVEEMVTSFWIKNENKIYSWYPQQKLPNDVIISASPEFLLLPICNTLCINHLIASKVDQNTGKFMDTNCYGEQKVHRYYEIYGSTQIDNFYSDSLSDAPLANIATHAFYVKKGTITKWPQ